MINLIAAVGLNGEIGLKGDVPWHDDPDFEDISRVDLNWFSNLTKDGVLVIGQQTINSMTQHGFRPGGRNVEIWFGSRAGMLPSDFLGSLSREYRNRNIWICGGAKTFKAFMPFVQRFYVSRIPWAGEADTYMPPILPNWSDNEPR